MAIEQVQSAHQRLSMLLALGVQAGFKTNDSMLQCACEAYGHRMSNDKLRTHLYWLAEQGLVKLTDQGSYILAELTNRGQECSEGLVTVPGVHKRRAR